MPAKDQQDVCDARTDGGEDSKSFIPGGTPDQMTGNETAYGVSQDGWQQVCPGYGIAGVGCDTEV